MNTRLPAAPLQTEYYKQKDKQREVKQALSRSWDGRLFDHNRHRRKIGGYAPFLWGELGPHL